MDKRVVHNKTVNVQMPSLENLNKSRGNDKFSSESITSQTNSSMDIPRPQNLDYDFERVYRIGKVNRPDIRLLGGRRT